VVLKPKNSRKPARKPGLARYELVLEAAARLILTKNSLEGLTLQAVANEAKVPRVSLYYFFASVNELIDTLYRRGVDRLMVEIGAYPESSDWRELMAFAIDATAEWYKENELEMVLSLSPYTVQFTENINPEIGRSIHAALVDQVGIPSTDRVARAFELVGDIADTIWRRSYIKHGKITADYNECVHEAVISFLAQVLDNPNSAT